MKKMIELIRKNIEKIGKQNAILIIFIIFILGIIGLYQTFSLYTTSEGESLVDGIKTYKFILSNSEENSVTIAAGSSKNLAISVTNPEEVNLRYGLYYYSDSSLVDVTIGYLETSEHQGTGIIEANQEYIIDCKVTNSTNSDIIINFGTKYGFENNGNLTKNDNESWLDLYVFTGIITPFVEEVMKTNAQSDDEIDFSETSEASGTNGIYLRSGTENNEVPIYYYRGNVNNNLIFANTCWKVVRTTETGGLKLLYNGLPSNGQCNNTGEATTIGDNYFNENYNSPAYVGYMYGNSYPTDYRSMDSSTQYVYGNGVNYSNGTYTLTNTKTATWSSVYESGLTNHHYTCFTTGTTCSSVYYIYNTTSTEAIYLTLTGVNNIETALSQMLDNNTYSSTIKGNNTTEGTLDYWYYTNIEQKGYSSYIEDTIWCNDRSIYSLGGFNPNGGSTYLDGDDGGMNAVLLHPFFEKAMSETPIPSLSCSRNVDKFTVSSSNGNGALDYPVGLLTGDEILLAGADTQFNSNQSYYLYNNYIYWAGSPIRFDDVGYAVESGVVGGGVLDGGVVASNYGVRPSVSLKPGFSIVGDGDGSVTNPYVVE